MPTAHLEHDNPPAETLRDAELVAALIFLARTVSAVELSIPAGTDDRVVPLWTASLLQHVVRRFGSGVRLENEAKALGERLGIALEVAIAPAQPVLVH